MQKISVMSAIVLCLAACTNKNTPVQDDKMKTDINNHTGQQLIGTTIPQERIISPDIYRNAFDAAEVVRYGRYTLVSTSPEQGQRYLLEQLVTISVPQRNKNVFSATVEQGLKITLKNTGLSLCTGFSLVSTLFSRPLPKVHYRFGPMKLREALQMIAGPAYELTLNDIQRTVCFKPRAVISDNSEAKPVEVITTTTEIIEE